MDFFKRIEFEFENIKELCEELNIDKYTYSYIENIKQEIERNSRDIDSYVFCLKKVKIWIEESKYRFLSTDIKFSRLKEIIYSLIEVSDDSRLKRDSTDIFLNEKTINNLSTMDISSDTTKTIIFLSHSSKDKKYANAIRNFISGIGVKDNCLIYTSHPNHKIPLDDNIFDYLRKNINQNVFMIILWSNSYLDSPACMNELGALWVVRGDYTSVFIPGFDFNNPKFNQSAIDTNKIGISLKNDSICKTRLIELKNKISKLFNLKVNEEKTTYLIDEFMKEIEA